MPDRGTKEERFSRPRNGRALETDDGKRAAIAVPLARICAGLGVGALYPRRGNLLALLPDLAVESIDTRTTVSDPDTVLVSGSLTAWIENPGTSSAPAGIRVLTFYDTNDNGVFEPMLDTHLGDALTGDEIPVDERLNLEIQVARAVPYRDAPVSTESSDSGSLRQNIPPRSG